jgi:hypothetical protein
MSDLTIMSVENARRNMARARKELERARIFDTHYRGVKSSTHAEPAEVHGTFVYRGRTYTK